MAIARRSSVSPSLAEALIETGEAEIVAALPRNRAAELSERRLLECLDRLCDDQRVHKAMIERDRLPATVTQRLVAVTCRRLGAELAARHALPETPEGEPGELDTDRPRWWFPMVVPDGDRSLSRIFAVNCQPPALAIFTRPYLTHQLPGDSAVAAGA
jgi:hypothetical protein